MKPSHYSKIKRNGKTFGIKVFYDWSYKSFRASIVSILIDITGHSNYSKLNLNKISTKQKNRIKREIFLSRKYDNYWSPWCYKWPKSS